METKLESISGAIIGKTIFLGLNVGDCLGATSEFQIPWEVGKNCVEVYLGWPGKIVGGGKGNWKKGFPTDDSQMAMTIVKSYKELRHQFIIKDIFDRFWAWAASGPKDIGSATRQTLGMTHKVISKKGTTKDPTCGAHEFYNIHPEKASNGSLMRNGAIAALFTEDSQEIEALDASVTQGILTHYSPLCVLCCFLHTCLIRKGIQYNWHKAELIPWSHDLIFQLFDQTFENWKKNTKNEESLQWLKNVGQVAIESAVSKLKIELKGFETWDPYSHQFKGSDGYVVISLKIALWGLWWSFQTEEYQNIPKWLPPWIFEKRKFDTISWVVAIGADADTYGAIAGPILAAFHGIEDGHPLTKGLLMKEQIEQYFTWDLDKIQKHFCFSFEQKTKKNVKSI